MICTCCITDFVPWQYISNTYKVHFLVALVLYLIQCLNRKSMISCSRKSPKLLRWMRNILLKYYILQQLLRNIYTRFKSWPELRASGKLPKDVHGSVNQCKSKPRKPLLQLLAIFFYWLSTLPRLQYLSWFHDLLNPVISATKYTLYYINKILNLLIPLSIHYYSMFMSWKYNSQNTSDVINWFNYKY